jgi:hypothetical protein
VNVFAEIKNNIQSLVFDCLYVYPKGDSSGPAMSLDQTAGAIITRDQHQNFLMPQSCEKEELGVGVKLTNWRQSEDVSDAERLFMDSVEIEFQSIQIEDLSKIYILMWIT